MINIENYVYTQVYNAVRTAHLASHPKLTVYGEYIDVPASLPCVTIYEADNYTYKESQDDSLTEHQAHVMYEVNVYVDCKNGKKALAKDIANTVDTTMQNMKFTRTLMNQIPNVDRTIYRITMRFEAVVGENFIMYRK